MKKIILILLLVFLPTIAFAGMPYISLNLVGTYPEDSKLNTGGVIEYELGLGGTFAIGFVTDGRDTNFRGEVEVGYRTSDFSNARGQVDLWSFMSNGYYDFSVTNIGKFTVGAGIGWSDIRLRPKGNKSLHDSLLAYQGMVGWSIPVSEYDFLDIQYRYIAVPGVEQRNVELDFGAHGIMIGFRMKL